MSRTDVQDTLREMWETRPARPRDDRQVAGVAAAIARRYDIDPVLVRVGFVVAALSGIGAALYVAGWILLPDEPADPAAPARRPRGLLVIGLAIAAAISMGAVFGGDASDVLLPLVAVAGLLYLLHRSRGGRAVDAATAPTTATAAAPAPARAEGPSLVKSLAVDPTEATPLTPPAWDPLGAAPFAWDLPEPAPAPAAPPPRRRPVTPVTLGLALLAGAGTAVVMLLAGTLTAANLPVLAGVVLAVLGAGLVLGSFLRAGRGLIPIALALAALTWALLAAPVQKWQGEGYGDLRAAPTTVATLLPGYERSVGEVDLDLRNLDLSVPANGNASPVRTRVAVGIGDVLVRVPPTADLSVTGEVGLGGIRFADLSEEGTRTRLNVVEDLGTDGVRSGRTLVLEIEAGLADVEVQRG